MLEVDVGDTVALACTFTDADGIAADPATVTLRVRSQWADVPTVYAGDDLSHDVGTGAYRRQVVATADGLWYWDWTSTGDPAAGDSGAFYARKSGV